MAELEDKQSRIRELLEKIRKQTANLDEVEIYQRLVDLDGLDTYRQYLRESKDTKEWFCTTCGGPIPCAIDCPGCGRKRPIDNWDEEVEGIEGRLRKRGKRRTI